MGSLDVIEPISTAVLRTRRILWEPFRVNTWLRLGFCAFVMGAAPAGVFTGGSRGSVPGSGTPSPLDGFDPGPLLAWMQQNSALVLWLVISALALMVVVVVLVTWVTSRGRFMMLDAVIHNRATILAAWREYRREAHSLFRFRLLLGVLTLLVVGVLLTVVLWFVVAEGNPAEPSLRLIMVTAIAFVLLLGWLLTIGLISELLLDFVAPVMAIRRLPVAAAWNALLHDLLRPHPAAVLCYLVVRALLNIAIAVMAVVVILLSCCLAALPYLGSVLLLPFIIFQITYPMAFLEQLGPDWRMFAPGRAATERTSA